MSWIDVRHMWADRFLRSSGLLLASTFVSSLLGFAFWALAARRYPVQAVGEGATLFSVVAFVANSSLLGLNTAVIRFLPTSRNRDSLVSTAITGVCLAAGTGAVIWLVGRPIFTPTLTIMSLSVMSVLAVIGIFVLFSLNVAIDSALLAHARSEYILAKNTVVAALRVALLLAVGASSGYALFVIATAPSAVGAVGAVLLLVTRLGHRLRPHIDLGFVRAAARFCGGNYLAVTFNSLPALVVPVLLTNAGEATSAAYFYVAWSVANLLYVAVMCVNLSFLAEGARDVRVLKPLVARAARVNGVVLSLLMVGTLVTAPLILSVFGRQYAHHAIGVLVFMVLTALFVSVSQVVSAILNLQGRVGSLTGLSMLNAALVMGAVVVLQGRGVTFVGLAWLGGNAAGTVAYIVVLFLDRRRDVPGQHAPKLRARRRPV